MTSNWTATTLLLTALLMGCGRTRRSDLNRGAASQPSGSMARVRPGVAATRPRRLAPRPSRAHPLLKHPRAKFLREFKLGNRTLVQYEILVEGPQDQVENGLSHNVSRYYTQALRSRGWSFAQATRAHEGLIEVYQHKSGSRLQFNIYGMSNWRRIKGKGTWVSHDLMVTFTFPVGIAPSTVLGAGYKD